MDKSDQILEAVNALAANLGGRMDNLDGRMDRLEADVTGLGKRMDKFEAGQIDIKERLIRVDARLDEQRQTVNALIPTKIAAVGGR